jgi:hypothetical protein
MTSTNLLRRAGLALLCLGVVVSAPAFAFIVNSGDGLPVKWQRRDISLKIMLGDSSTLSDGSTYNSSASVAAQTWNNVIGAAQIQTTFVTGSASNNNGVSEIAFATTVFGRDFGSGVLAVTTTGSARGNEILEADILVNSKDYSWDSYRGPSGNHPGKIDLQRVTIHEMGHFLGLDHPDEHNQSVNAIMNSHVSNVDTLTADDIAGIRSLYGPPGVPANDNFASAVVLNLNGSQSVSVSGSNTNATKEAGDPRQGDNPGGRSVWWRWTAPSAGAVTIDTGKENTTTHVTDLTDGKSSYFDTTLGVYTGTSLANLVKVTDNDDIKSGVVQVSKVTFNATGGTNYWIQVDGFNNVEQDATDQNGADSGGIKLSLTFGGDLGTAPTITTQPASATVDTGGSASFSVAVAGSAPLSYQWLFNSSALSGATNPTLNLSSITTAQAGTYSVTVSNAAGSVTSSGATLTVNTPPPPPPPPPAPSGGGGGGAPSPWFCTALAALGLGRLLRRNRP